MATPQQVLDTPMDPNDSGADTIRGYLKALLYELWREQEAFNGKRPWGNSGWESDIYRALVKIGYVEGELDEDGYLDTMTSEAEEQADNLVLSAISSL